MIEESITQRIAELSPQYRSFVESNFAEIASRAFGEANNFDLRKIEILENAFTFYLLFFFDEQIAISFIVRNCDLSKEDATTLFTAMRSTLPEGLDEMIRTQAASLQAEPPTALESEIAETERVFENLQGIRTMAADMREAKTHAEPTYQSSQSDLITPTTPPPPPQNGPRWETDK